MRIWELFHTYGRDERGNATSGFTAELSEQPVACYLAGWAAERLWAAANRRLPRRLIDPRYDPPERPFGPRLRLELWCSYTAARWRRRPIEWVPVQPRNPDTWYRKGGDAPWTPPQRETRPGR